MTSTNHLSLSLVDSVHEHCLLTNLEPPPRKDLHTNTKPHRDFGTTSVRNTHLHRVHALLGKSPHPWPPARALPNPR
jgi:hypothetical protein